MSTVGFDRRDSKLASEKDKDDGERNPCVVKLEKVINHWAVTTTMTIVTVYALFGDDIRLAFFTKSADDTFFTLTFISLILFSLELTLNSIATPDYFNSFYFWLDLVSTISLITDIGWIWDAIVGTSDY